MEFLTPAVVVILTQIYKKFVDYAGEQYARAISLIIVFILSATVTFSWEIYNGDLDDWTDIAKIGETMALAVGYYELLVKTLLAPVFEKVKTLIKMK